MNLIIEWEGISGLIKIILVLSLIFFSGFYLGRKTRK